MRILSAHLLSCLLATRALAVAVGAPLAAHLAALAPRQPTPGQQDTELDSHAVNARVGKPVDLAGPQEIFSQPSALEKRKGGGRGGGRGGSSSGSRGGSGGSSSSSSRTSPGSNVGGRTSSGSGPTRSYGGGRAYGGGAAAPFAAGSRSPSGIIPVLLGVGAAALLFWGANAWPHGAYSYPYTQRPTFFNASAQQNQTVAAVCLCDTNQECGCDNNTDAAYIQSVVGNGSYAGLNRTLVTVADINGTHTLLVNGTLPNGTTAAGAGMTLQAGMLRGVMWWPVLATLFSVVFASI